MKSVAREMIETPTFMTKNPCFIPGYSGYCPQYKFKGIGGTYGHFTNEILTNPPWKSTKSVLQQIKPENIPPRAVAAANEELRKYSRSSQDPLIYSENMKTGYAGLVPHSENFQGETFYKNSLQAVAEFNRQQRDEKQLMKNLDDKVNIQSKKIALKNLPPGIEAAPMAIRYGAPLPQTNAKPTKYKPRNTFQYSKSPYDMENDDPNKFLKSGHSGFLPLIGEKCGYNGTRLTRDSLNEFKNGRIYYKPPKTIETIKEYDGTKLPPYVHPPPPVRSRSPIAPRIIVIDPKAEVGEYPVQMGLPTTYRGHIQGLKDVVGMTYGTATRYLNKLRCPNVLNQHTASQRQKRHRCIIR